MAYRHIVGLSEANLGCLPKRKWDSQYLSYYEMLCVDYDVLILHIGHVQTSITSSLSVSHAAAPSARLDCMQLCLVRCLQIVRRLAAETFARRAFVCSQGVKRYPGKGKDYLKNVFPQHLWFGSCVFPNWCGIVCLHSEW